MYGPLSYISTRGSEQLLQHAREGFGRAYSLIHAEAEQKRKAGHRWDRVEGRIESLIQGRSRYRGEDWDRLKRSASEERMEQVREFDGEQAYEKMRRAMEEASQEKARQAERARQVEKSLKFPALKRPERRGPERSGPERDFGPSR